MLTENRYFSEENKTHYESVFSRCELKNLRSKKIKPEDNVQWINWNQDACIVNFEIENSGKHINTYWPIHSSLQCISPSKNWLLECNSLKEVLKPGKVANFFAKIEVPKGISKQTFVFSLVDELGRTFGDKFELKMETIKSELIDSIKDKVTAFILIFINYLDTLFLCKIDILIYMKYITLIQDLHIADILYPKQLMQLRWKGDEITTELKAKIIHFKGDIKKIV